MLGKIFMKSESGDMVPFDSITTVNDLSEGPTDDGLVWRANGLYDYSMTADTQTFTAHIRLTKVQRLMMFYQLRSVREARLVIRREEQLRRWMLKTGNQQFFLTCEVWAVCDVVGLRGRYRKLRSKSQSEM